MSNRKDFKKWAVETVWDTQQGLCIKCGRSLEQGFHKHHLDGDSSNNSIENLQLICATCHGSEQYKTLQNQRIKHLKQIDSLVDLASTGEVSGAVIDKITELIKLGLSLENKVYSDIELPPVNIRLQYNTLFQESLLREYKKGYEDGFKDGIQLSMNMLTNIRLPEVNLNELEDVLKKLRRNEPHES